MSFAARPSGASSPTDQGAGLKERLYLRGDDVASVAGHVPSLDGLRAISVAIVVIAHISRIEQLPGGFGVTMFFFISGYIITRLLYVEQKQNASISIAAFYERRVARLYPVLISFLVASVVVCLIKSEYINYTEIFSVLFYFSNYYQSILGPERIGLPTGSGIFWSLSVEEHFYLVFPLCFLLFGHRLNRFAIFVCLICLASPAIRLGYHLFLDPAVAARFTYYNSEARFDSIGYGVLLAIVLENERLRKLAFSAFNPILFAIAIAVLLLTFLVRDELMRNVLRYTIQGIALFVVIGAILTQRWLAPLQRILNTSALIFIGKISYSLYVWHLFSAYLCRPLAAKIGHVPYTLTAIALSVAISVASYHVIEKPFIALRKRLHRRRQPLALQSV